MYLLICPGVQYVAPADIIEITPMVQYSPLLDNT